MVHGGTKPGQIHSLILGYIDKHLWQHRAQGNHFSWDGETLSLSCSSQDALYHGTQIKSVIDGKDFLRALYIPERESQFPEVWENPLLEL